MHAMSDETDEILAARVRDDRYDTRPFDVLVHRHKGFVVSNCRVLTRSDADAEDLAQEVFVKAYFGIHQFEERGGFRAWIKRIKVNHCLNFLRKGRGRQVVDIDEVSPGAHEGLRTETDPQQALDSLEERRRIVEVLDSMADTLRVPLMLRDGDGFSYQEIAEQLGIGLSAVKMRIKRGREEFRRLYGDGEGPVGAAETEGAGAA
jgi:RNA polymerase sigma-70 factor, ECF subfamily